MAKNVSGSPRGFTSNGIPYTVAADADIAEMISEFENSMLPTSGIAMRKMTRRITGREGIVLSTNAAERELLKSDSEDIDDGKFSYTNAAGDTYMCEGTMEIEGNQTDTNRTTVKVFPRDKWTPLIVP